MVEKNCFGDVTKYDFANLCEGLTRYLKLKATPIGMKRFRKVEQMQKKWLNSRTNTPRQHTLSYAASPLPVKNRSTSTDFLLWA